MINEMDLIKPTSGSVALWFLGQSGFAIKGSDRIIYLDPYLSDYLTNYTKGKTDEDPRKFNSPLSPEKITNASLVFGSHYHFDHIDPKTVQTIHEVSPLCKFVFPPLAASLVELNLEETRIIQVEAYKQYQIDGISFQGIPSAHEEINQLPDGRYKDFGYIIEINGVKIYHSGDCVPYKGLVERLKKEEIDIALLPINGRDFFRLQRGFLGNFTYQEAGEMASAIGANLLIPMHFGMHMSNTEHPGALVDYLCDKFPEQKFHIMIIGECLIYSNEKFGSTVTLMP